MIVVLLAVAVLGGAWFMLALNLVIIMLTTTMILCTLINISMITVIVMTAMICFHIVVVTMKLVSTVSCIERVSITIAVRRVVLRVIKGPLVSRGKGQTKFTKHGSFILHVDAIWVRMEDHMQGSVGGTMTAITACICQHRACLHRALHHDHSHAGVLRKHYRSKHQARMCLCQTNQTLQQADGGAGGIAVIGLTLQLCGHTSVARVRVLRVSVYV